jgi:hypothetical protein
MGGDEQPCQELIFLPAPRTWIEHRGTKHLANFLVEVDDQWIDHFVVYDPSVRDEWLFWKVARINRQTARTHSRDVSSFEDQGDWIKAALALINTPKIIGRRQHMPNRALERELTRKMGVGKFPLHAWTEIYLQVSKPPEIDDGEPHEAHLTGQRALHFCRKHLRVRLGRIEYVSAHWRGDPALGIKRSRYTLAP